MTAAALPELTAADLATMLANAGGMEALRFEFMDKGDYKQTPIGRLAGLYLDGLLFDNFSESTYKNRLQTLSWLAFDHPTKQPDEFTHDILRKFLAEHWSDAAANTKAVHVQSLRTFFSWCEDNGYVDRDPARKVRAPRKKDTERRSHSQDVIRALVVAQDERRDKVALLTMYWCGLRRNELRLVQFRHIDLARRLLTVFGKGGTVLEQNIPAPLALELERHIQDSQAQPDEYLLYPRKLGRRGHWPAYEPIVIWEDKLRPLTVPAIDKWFQRCRARAGMPDVVMHELRHSAGTHMQETRRDLLATQYFLRHKSAATTERTYIHLDRSQYVADAQRDMPDPMADGE